MSFIRFTAFKCRILLTILISLNREIINPCSHCIKKVLVYIVLIFPFRHQPFSYLECIKVNTQSSYNVYSVPFNEYICLIIHY
jgi:hypothetical protein